MKRKMKLSLVVVALLGLLVLSVPALGSDANLVAHWALDEGSGTIAYDSAGDNDGTIHDASWTEGRIGGALSFGGGGDYVDCGTGLALMEVSVCAWVKISDGGGQIVFSKKGKSYGGHEAYSLVTGDMYASSGVGTVSTRIKQPGSVSFIDLATTERIDDGEWHFIAMSYDGTIAKIYIDGDLKVASPAGNAINYYSEIEPAGIGATRSTDGSPAAFFNGLIDEVMIFNRALSGEEVEELYLEAFSGSELAVMRVENALDEKQIALEAVDAALVEEADAYEALEELLDSKDYGDLKKGDVVKAKQRIGSAMQHQEQSADALEKGIEKLEDALLSLGWEPEPEPNEPEPDPNLVAHWKFDESSGTMAYDSAGSSHGTLINGPIWTIGQIDGALEFDGVDDYISCGTGPAITGTEPFAVSVWVKTNASKGQAVLVQRSESSAHGSYGVSILDDGRVQFHIYNGGYGVLFQSDVTVNDGLWHHIAVVRTNSTDGEIYVDGSLSGSDSGPARSLNNVPVWIGGPGFTGPFDFEGSIDDVRIYDRALSVEEVEQLHQDGL